MSELENARQTFRDLSNEGIPDSDIKYLLKLARQHHSLQERYCNNGWTEQEEKTQNRVESTIREILKPYEIRAKFTGDPRGFTVKLFLKSGKYNTWGGSCEGYGI